MILKAFSQGHYKVAWATIAASQAGKRKGGRKQKNVCETNELSDIELVILFVRETGKCNFLVGSIVNFNKLRFFYSKEKENG